VALTTLLAGIVIALILRRLRVAVFLTVTVMLMGLLTLAPKGLAVRPRPETALAFEASTAFPSGHELGITVAVLAFTTVLWPPLGLGMRLPAIAPGAVLVVVVGFYRVVLNVHHPSDVIAGWALGLPYYLLCLRLVPPSVR
jgi:membrane-associated phospholipid phosphatase